MTKSLLSLLTVACLYSCNPTEKKELKSTIANFKTLDTLVPFSGFWLNEAYIKDINRFKSPSKSQNLSESCIRIPERTLQITTMVSGFHEGAAEITVLKNGNRFQFYYKYDDTIREQAYDIQILSKDKIKIGSNIFVKTNEKFLEDILFSGDYLDSLGNKIQFLKDGHIIGLDNFTIYDPTYDYTGPGMEVDQIDLGQNLKKMTPYGFKFNQDTLLIYNLTCLVFDSTDKTCEEVELGGIKYKLTKVH